MTEKSSDSDIPIHGLDLTFDSLKDRYPDCADTLHDATDFVQEARQFYTGVALDYKLANTPLTYPTIRSYLTGYEADVVPKIDAEQTD